MTDKRIRRRAMIGALAAGMLLAPAAAGWTAAAAQSGWQAEWERTVAAANKEGTLVLAAPRPVAVRKAITRLWNKDFPNISLQLSPGGGGGWPTRVKTERKAGKFLWDVYFSGPSMPTFKLAPKVMAPLLPALILPEAKDAKAWGGWDEAFIDRDGKRLFSIWSQVQSIYYDAKAIAPERVAKLGLRILLEPEFKGKLAWQDPRGRGPGINPAMLIYKVLGEDALNKVFIDQKPVFYSRASQAVEAVVRGKQHFFLGGNMMNRLTSFTKAGLDLDMRAFGNDAKTAYLSVGAVMMGLFDRPPHPNAAKVFVNWVLTKKVQAALSKMSKNDSRRRDVPKYFKGPYAARDGEKYLVFQREEVQPERRALQLRLKKLRAK